MCNDCFKNLEKIGCLIVDHIENQEAYIKHEDNFEMTKEYLMK